MDEDLDAMSESELLGAARSMRAAIRAHRDSTMHDLCWHHPEMWALLPDPPAPDLAVPEWPQFMRGCVAYRASLDVELADTPRSAQEFSPGG